MDIANINHALASADIDPSTLFSHVQRLRSANYIFDNEFPLNELPQEPGILLIRGARQYGKSTWLELQIVKTIETFGAGSAAYLNSDFIANAEELSLQLENIATSFQIKQKIKRIFIDEITAIHNWELILKRLVDNGLLRDILVITTGSKATDLRRGAERLPGRKGNLEQTNYLFTPISYKSFYSLCHKKLKSKTLPAYLISGGSPIACSEIASHGYIPEYVIQLVRDWVEGEIAKSGRHRSALLNILKTLFRFGSAPIGQAKLAREAGLANNSVAQGYIEILNDLGCIMPAYPIDIQKQQLILRKPCKYHYANLLVAIAYHPAQIRNVEDFESLPEKEQGMWYEWLVAQELLRRNAIHGEHLLEPQAFWQSKQHEVDFYTSREKFLEVKRGNCTALEFSWFTKQFNSKLTVINKNSFETKFIHGVTMEEFLLDFI